MKIGIFTEARFVRSFNYHKLHSGLYEPKEYGIADLSLDPLIEDIITRSKTTLGQNGLPMVFFGNTGHTGVEDVGMIHISHQANFVPEDDIKLERDNPSDFVRSEALFRTSFGPHHNRAGWLINTFSRLHLNVYGGRTYFPENWQDLNLKADRFDLHADPPDKTALVEIAHVSMRWIDNQFDDWSDKNTWPDGSDFHNKKFHLQRSSYMLCKRSIHTKQGMFDGLPKNQQIREAVKIPLTTEPIVGYSPVLDLLSQYQAISVTDPETLNNMTLKQGADFMLDEVLPAMLAYTNLT